MESSTSLLSSPLRFSPFSAATSSKRAFLLRQKIKRPASGTKVVVAAARREAHDQNCGGRLVDESMIVLRKRIHEMKMVERNYEPPADWMEWEKRCYTSYDSIICDLVGALQSQLMNTRPSVALGMAALIAFSVPTSTAVLLHHLVEIIKGVGVLAAGIH